MKFTNKKIISIILTLAMVTSLFTVALTANAAEENKVRVIIQNNVFSTADGAAWDGTLVDEWVAIDENTTMTSAIVDALNNHGYSQTGADSNYFTEINGLSAYDNYYASGWLGTLNDWFTSEGMGSYAVSNGNLENGDEIALQYSNDWGSDIGSLWSSSDTSLANISFSTGALSTDFSSSTKEYTLTLPANTTGITVTPTATNKNYQVRTYKNSYTPDIEKSEYKRSAQIDVQNGDKIIVGVGNSQWPSMNGATDESVYTFNVVTENKADSIYNATTEHLLSLNTPTVGSVGGEWLALGLARADKISADFKDGYYNNVVNYVENVGSAKLSSTKSTENSRVILGLTSINKDVTNVGGYNLLEPLADYNFVTKQGLNGAVFALLAFDSKNYAIPVDGTVTVQTTRENLINCILEKQLSNGGWTFFGSTADPDMTGMALQALAPYYNTNSDVKSAVDNALSVISEMQNDNGGFASWGTVNSESCAQIITALTNLGINPDTDERFIKNGNSALDALLSFATDNGFTHTQNGSYNQMATEQSYYALVSYYRLINGKTSLYDMTDLINDNTPKDVNRDGVVDISDCTFIQRYIAGMVTVTDKQLADADYNKDGFVTIDDATLMQRYFAGV